MTSGNDPRRSDLFYNIIKAAFFGEPFIYKRKRYGLQPTLVQPSDFYRRSFGSSLTSYESLLKDLDPRFKSVARTEI